jgi:hypothetical protein
VEDGRIGSASGYIQGKVLLIGFLHFRWFRQGVILGSIALLLLLLFGLLSDGPLTEKERPDAEILLGALGGWRDDGCMYVW